MNLMLDHFFTEITESEFVKYYNLYIHKDEI